MKKLFTIAFILLAIPCTAQRTGKINWNALFEIHDSQPGVIREAKITSRFFKRLPGKPTVWQRDMTQAREGIEYEWTEEIHLNAAKPDVVIFITTDPFEFERLIQALTTKGATDEFGVVSEGESFAAMENRVLASGRKISRFSKDDRIVEVLSNNHGGIEEWIFQLSKGAPSVPPSKPKADPPLIAILEPNQTGTKSIGETELSKTQLKIRVTDPDGIRSVLFDGTAVKLGADGIFTKTIILPANLTEKTFPISATDKLGNSATSQFVLKRAVHTANPLAKSDTLNFREIAGGRYYALIISVQNYAPGIPPLANPHRDGDSLASVLLTRYKFGTSDIKILKDPTVPELGRELGKLKTNLTMRDNLIIFFSGHGEWDESAGQGYWLLRDAEFQNQATWISNSTVKDYIRAINSRHTLLVTDACFGGSISKNADNKAEKAIYTLPSRVAITSGNLEKVPDKSVFMKYFLERLRDNHNQYMTARTFFDSFYLAVISNAGEDTPHQPQYSQIYNTGHQGGDFVFSLK